MQRDIYQMAHLGKGDAGDQNQGDSGMDPP